MSPYIAQHNIYGSDDNLLKREKVVVIDHQDLKAIYYTFRVGVATGTPKPLKTDWISRFEFIEWKRFR